MKGASRTKFLLVNLRITPFEAKELVLLVITNAKNHGNLNDMQNM